MIFWLNTRTCWTYVTTYLLHGLTFGHKLISDFDSGVAQSLQHISRVQTQKVGNFVSSCNLKGHITFIHFLP